MNPPLITSGFKIAYSHESAIFCTVWQHTNLLFLRLLDYTTAGQIPSLCVIFLRAEKCFWDISRILHGVLPVCSWYTSSCCRSTWEPLPSTASCVNGLILASCLPSPMAMGYISYVTLRNGQQSYCPYFLFHFLQLWDRNLVWTHHVFSVLLRFGEV